MACNRPLVRDARLGLATEAPTWLANLYMTWMRGRTYSVVLTALVSAVSAVGQDQLALAGSEWRPIEIQGMYVSPQAEIFVQFRVEGGLAGHAGCRFVGAYRVEGDRIEIDTGAAGCPSPIDDVEARFRLALEAATGYRRNRTRLSLLDREGNSVVRFIQTDWD